ncbi:MAG: GPR1/FUN34/YaaH family transporter [Eubacteriales bacterium]|nr:GPR1/FUN34/YaaH family transporter [Eubacteriales bacterium]MDD3349551.1 GPR1/FUN34/YaaH family transporter [Eubacteriales bacterium]
METNETKVVLKEWANPTPAGLVALAVACVCFFALLTGRVGVGAMPLLGCWLLGGFVIQLCVGLLDLKGGNYTGGNVFLFFSGFFMLASGIEMLLKYQAITAGTPLDGRLDGYVWVTLAVTLILWTPAFCKKLTLLSFVVIFIDIALPFIGLIDLGVVPKDYAFIPAWALLFAAITAVYLASALVVNAALGKKVYPTL